MSSSVFNYIADYGRRCGLCKKALAKQPAQAKMIIIPVIDSPSTGSGGYCGSIAKKGNNFYRPSLEQCMHRRDIMSIKTTLLLLYMILQRPHMVHCNTQPRLVVQQLGHVMYSC